MHQHKPRANNLTVTCKHSKSTMSKMFSFALGLDGQMGLGGVVGVGGGERPGRGGAWR